MVAEWGDDIPLKTLFQYSLCRVVLMVMDDIPHDARCSGFQYSLCRVVLMVCWQCGYGVDRQTLSVLALSSRFDGRILHPRRRHQLTLSVLALSSRFDGLGCWRYSS